MCALWASSYMCCFSALFKICLSPSLAWADQPNAWLKAWLSPCAQVLYLLTLSASGNRCRANVDYSPHRLLWWWSMLNPRHPFSLRLSGARWQHSRVLWRACSWAAILTCLTIYAYLRHVHCSSDDQLPFPFAWSFDLLIRHNLSCTGILLASILFHTIT